MYTSIGLRFAIEHYEWRTPDRRRLTPIEVVYTDPIRSRQIGQTSPIVHNIHRPDWMFNQIGSGRCIS